MKCAMLFVVSLILSLATTQVSAQSSSLFVDSAVTEVAPPPVQTNPDVPTRLSPAIAQVSVTAVKVPPPAVFKVHDLITIIIRESTQNDSSASIDTSKEAKVDGTISAFPSMNALLSEFRLAQSTFPGGTPEVGIDLGNEFEGEGSYKRSDSFTSRITARIIDIKPNGTMVLEARKYIQSDKESLNLVLTGTGRSQEIACDNTVRSTQLYDLNLVNEHKGELRNATKKGLFTKVFETLFNF